MQNSYNYCVTFGSGKPICVKQKNSISRFKTDHAQTPDFSFEKVKHMRKSQNLELKSSIRGPHLKLTSRFYDHRLVRNFGGLPIDDFRALRIL